MALQISSILPVYFDADRINGSEIWGKQLLFEKGQFIKIIAPSGSGKTSLIHFLYGMRQDYNGTIQYDTKAIRQLPPEEMAELRKNTISVVFQDLRLFPDQTVFQNIDIKRQLNAFHQKEKIKEMAEQLGIASRLGFRCGICSYGEQQRVAIIRALMQPFDYLLLDEPFSHLDDLNSEKAMKLMIEEADRRKAAIIFADLERVDFFPYQKLFHL